MTAHEGPTGARRRLRVQFLTHSLEVGGSERQMVELALRLPKDRFEPSFLLLRARGELAQAVEDAGIQVRVLGFRRPRGGLPGLVVALAANVAAIGRYVRWTRRRADIVDAWLFHAYVLAALCRPATSQPVLIAGRRSLSDFKDGFGRVARWADAVARRRSDLLIANSELVRDDVVRRERIARTRIVVIRNGVAAPAPCPEATRTALRRRWGAGDGDVVIGCVANYKPLKGLESIVRVVAALQPTHPEMRVVLVGEGPLRPLLESMIAEAGLAGTITLHGAEPDARALYGAFDIAVQASETEGLPNVVLEAAAAGNAIVATDAGGTPEIVTDGTTGLLVPVGDDGALGAAIDRLLSDGALRARLGAAAASDAATRFGFDRLVRETVDAYERAWAQATSKRPQRAFTRS